jgi:hypothetical protein
LGSFGGAVRMVFFKINVKLLGLDLVACSSGRMDSRNPSYSTRERRSGAGPKRWVWEAKPAPPSVEISGTVSVGQVMMTASRLT